jgi:hypothetical protein
MYPRLFNPYCRHRLDSAGATRRNQCGEHGGREQQDGCAGEADRIERADLIEDDREHSAEQRAQAETGADPDEGSTRNPRRNTCRTIRAGVAPSALPEAELAGSPRHDVALHAVEPHDGEKCGGCSEDAEHPGGGPQDP